MATAPPPAVGAAGAEGTTTASPAPAKTKAPRIPLTRDNEVTKEVHQEGRGEQLVNNQLVTSTAASSFARDRRRIFFHSRFRIFPRLPSSACFLLSPCAVPVSALQFAGAEGLC
jgi:hypothetical protein